MNGTVVSGSLPRRRAPDVWSLVLPLVFLLGVVPVARAGEPAKADNVVLVVKGYVIPAHLIQITPSVGGEIVWLDPAFKEGARYKKGDKLAEIDPQLYKAQLKSAAAALEIAKINLEKVEKGSAVVDVEAAQAQLKRLQAVLERSFDTFRDLRNAGASTTPSELKAAEAHVRVDQAAVDVQKENLAKVKLLLEEQRRLCRAQLTKAEAGVEQAAKQLKSCTITAPTTGIILSKKAELGGYVNPLAFGAAGYLCEMGDLTDLEVELSVEESDIARLAAGQKCIVMPVAYRNDKTFLKKHPEGYQGRVTRILPIADRAKGAIGVRVAIDRAEISAAEEGVYLKPEMSVIVSFRPVESEK